MLQIWNCSACINEAYSETEEDVEMFPGWGYAPDDSSKLLCYNCLLEARVRADSAMFEEVRSE